MLIVLFCCSDVASGYVADLLITFYHLSPYRYLAPVCPVATNVFPSLTLILHLQVIYEFERDVNTVSHSPPCLCLLPSPILYALLGGLIWCTSACRRPRSLLKNTAVDGALPLYVDALLQLPVG